MCLKCNVHVVRKVYQSRCTKVHICKNKQVYQDAYLSRLKL